jgi:zona occludens toxin (predicted ATPase)
MIVFYVGTPGSGKTYEAMLVVIESLSKGRVVYTNIDGVFDIRAQVHIAAQASKKANKDKPVTVDAVKNNLRKLSKENVCQFWKVAEKGSLVIIDETQKYFNAKDWKVNPYNRELSDWADEHRHDGYDVLLLTPSFGKVDSGVRSIAEWVYAFRKMNMFGSLLEKKYRIRIHYGDNADGAYETQDTRTYKKEIFACYKSYFADGTEEKKFVKGANLLKHPIFFIIPLAIIATVFFLSRSPLAHGDLLGAKSQMERAKKGAGLAPPGMAGGLPAPSSSSDASTPYPPAVDSGSVQISTAPIILGSINGKPIMKNPTTGKITIPRWR